MTTAKRWSYKAGERGRNRVRAYEEKPGGFILVEFHELEADGTRRKRVSLRHRDQERAKQQADDMAAAFGRSHPPDGGDITLGTLFDNYMREVTPGKSEGKQKHDAACAEMFLRYFGRDRKARTLNVRDWSRFIRERGEGRIAPRHKRHPGPVRQRQIAYDLSWLMAVLNWATRARDKAGKPLLDTNPLKGCRLPKEESPRRPVLKQAQYDALLAVAPAVDWRFELALVLTHETGHRIGAIRQLRWTDIDLDGLTVRWRAENDKLGFEHTTPLTDAAVDVLRRARRAHKAIGDAWLFPAPKDPDQPCSRHLMRNWWGKAQKLAGLQRTERLGWHSLRRKFATELRNAPLKDLCELGGWKDPNTILKCYQQADEAAMRTALAKRQAI